MTLYVFWNVLLHYIVCVCWHFIPALHYCTSIPPAISPFSLLAVSTCTLFFPPFSAEWRKPLHLHILPSSEGRGDLCTLGWD